MPGAPGPILNLRNAGLGFSNSMLPINDAGDAAVGARFVGGGTEVSIVVCAPGSLTIVAQPGMQAPGLPPGVTFTSPLEYTVWLQSQDRILFQSTLSSPTQSYGLFTGLPGNLALLALDGDQAAGTDPGFFAASSRLPSPGSVPLKYSCVRNVLTGLGVQNTSTRTGCGSGCREHCNSWLAATCRRPVFRRSKIWGYSIL